MILHVICMASNVIQLQVTGSLYSVDLSNTNVAGPFPTLLCSLQNLFFISLYDNFINSFLPEEISACVNLQHLDLAQNLFVGPLPSLSDIPKLHHLDLRGNNFSSNILTSLGRFSRLEVLSLVGNFFNRTTPSSEFARLGPGHEQSSRSHTD
ncbi:hypothetical protein NE237_000618 [Protea cynaroides]|uniref:Uncharacterized protein n=1 Tax=Protea cynaroides TaxID=273540 RepID=A0A9Q0KRS7_9MAGN|nr:hypothetical protein NE237_000618 [Protea cynaroides]